MHLASSPINSDCTEVELNQQTDDQLVAAVLKGQIDAFEKIMRRYNQRNFRIARAYIREEDEAMDVVQEAYVLAYTQLKQYQRSNRFAGWLGRIVRNEALMRLRKHKKLTYLNNDMLVDVMDETLTHATVTQPENKMANQQLGAIIEECIDSLPEDFKIVFMMRGVEQLSILETAELLGIKPETIKTRFHRARQLLQQQITNRLDVKEYTAFEFAGHRCDAIVANVMKRLVIRD